MNKIIGIVAIDSNYAIGKDNKIPWKLKADMKHFQETTTSSDAVNFVVMGRKTFQSIGRKLPNRTNVVFSKSGFYAGSDCLNESSKEDFLEFLKTDNQINPESKVFIIGGLEIYRLFANDIDQWIVTSIPEEVENADTFMDKDFLSDFICTYGKQVVGEKLRIDYYHRSKLKKIVFPDLAKINPVWGRHQ